MPRWLWIDVVGGLLAVAVVVIVAGAIACALRARSRRQPDPALRLQRPIQKFTGYDQRKAVAGRERWQQQSRSGHPWRSTARAQAVLAIESAAADLQRGMDSSLVIRMELGPDDADRQKVSR
jgi:hypothetical protein